MTPAELGNHFEQTIATALRGKVACTPHYDVIASHLTIECKSRTIGSDGRASRTGLYQKYFAGHTTAFAIGYYTKSGEIERALLVPAAALKAHFDKNATIYKGEPRWRPTRAFLEHMPETRDITLLTRRGLSRVM